MCYLHASHFADVLVIVLHPTASWIVRSLTCSMCFAGHGLQRHGLRLVRATPSKCKSFKKKSAVVFTRMHLFECRWGHKPPCLSAHFSPLSAVESGGRRCLQTGPEGLCAARGQSCGAHPQIRGVSYR